MAKLTPEILDEIVASFHRVGGEKYLDALAMADPPLFCQLLGKVIQGEIKAEIPVSANQINLGEAMAAAEARLAKLDRDQ
jgi:hypothetical protein